MPETLVTPPPIPDWDTYFMTMVYLVAMRSKDEATHVGAVIVDSSNRVVGTGCNSFPRGIDDHNPERQLRPEKYLWFLHAENNGIINARTSVQGCRMYTNGIPCMERCAGLIVNAGITEVIVDEDWDQKNMERWQAQAPKTQQLFKEAGVKLRFWKGDLLQIKKYRRGTFF